jgi:hypothetical protein
VVQADAQGAESLAVNVTLQSVSQYAHVGWGYIFVTFPTLLLGPKVLWWTAGAVLIGTGIKEYADCHGLEMPDVSGGVKGSWQDFAFWCVGNALGTSTCLLAAHIGGLV